MLEEGVSDHRHERMTVKALPGSSLEVIETEFFFQLLVSLLANPSRLDGGRQGAQVRLCRQVGEIVFLLSRHPVFAEEPGLFPWQMLLALVPDSLWWSVCYAHTDGGETSLELSLPCQCRQLMFCQVASASISSAAIDRTSRECAAYGDGRALATGQIICTSAGYTLM